MDKKLMLNIKIGFVRIFNIMTNRLKLSTYIAAIMMLLPLPVLQYIGEESFYTLGAFEMHARHIWSHQPLLGADLPRTPMFSWFIIGICKVIGWNHLDIAPRIISVLSSWGTAGVIFYMARRLFPEKANAGWYGALIFLTMGETFFWYGWLGYADACFGFFIFSAIMCFWIAIEDRRPILAFLSSISISCAFLVKNISCYGIFLIACSVLLYRYRQWKLLLTPGFFAAALTLPVTPLIYQSFVIHTFGNANMAISHALDNFLGFGIWDYLKHWLVFPLLFVARAFPVSIFLPYIHIREKRAFKLEPAEKNLVWLIIFSIAPFWFSANASPRYMVPFYGLFALLLTGILLRMDPEHIRKAIKIIVVIIFLKIPYSLAILPCIKDWLPSNSILAVADDIHSIVGNKPVRTLDGIASFLSLAAYIDAARPPKQYIRWYNGHEKHVYVFLRNEPSPAGSILIKTWQLRGNPVRLFWVP